MKWYLKALKQYANFSGRAQRAEFWYFMLFFSIILFVLIIIDNILGYTIEDQIMGILSVIFLLSHLLPNLAVSTRRLHDTNKSAWWWLITWIPLIGQTIFMSLMALDSKADNKYGVNPKGSKIAKP